MKRLAIITTHPIQYNAPVFRMLASDPALLIRVFYTLGKTSVDIIDKGFGKKIDWGIPLLEGYDFRFVPNTSKDPGTSYFKGVVNPTLIRELEAFQPTNLLVFGWNFKSHLKVLRHFKNKVPIYFRGDSTLLDEEKGGRLFMRRLALTWTYHYIDKAFFVGTNNKQYFLKHGVKEKNLVFAPHAVDNERFGNDLLYQEEGEKIRNQLGIPKEHTVFMFTGKFEKKKNPLLLIQAFQKLNKKESSLLLVGNGALEGELKKKAEGEPNIYFLPFQNQNKMPAIYRAGDVLVLPSSGPGETWGLCMNEAMASGLPVIASTKVGGAVDLVQESKNGFIFESCNINCLEESLQQCLNKTKEELAAMGKVSKTIIANWSFQHICEAILTEVQGK
ncbi:glycosyltransferase involved in cell wall biosynthesis [Pontibacter ummariensis]|uniref:Glycosyltransferase involved in cell wall bisynthesis n=1 Tax=Pontibacter ummariensis TaxID=1610492 RepID=A0A239BPM8_9BACT|nr:glycosyltransferase family 4 protein [Pontibacter ummariensis]PRY15746.1 glycosyltransferase involved in cell wall biosynthesis [Pontibacter ummariensis]SNS09033.1 Glycosyltransferase involved in cell wall bisynthesis [Pontibacter ummariensis]